MGSVKNAKRSAKTNKKKKKSLRMGKYASYFQPRVGRLKRLGEKGEDISKGQYMTDVVETQRFTRK